MPDVIQEHSLNEAAMALHLSRERTLRLLLLGKLRGRKEGSRWLIDVASIEQLQRQQQLTPAA